MANLGFTLMIGIAAAMTLASCDTQPRSLFADEPVASSSAQPAEGTEKGYDRRFSDLALSNVRR